MCDRVVCLRVGSAGWLVLAVLHWTLAPAGSQTGSSPFQCHASGPLVRVAQLPEASGIAASRRTPGRFWAHNDSSRPALVALDRAGAATGWLTVPGARVEDWEAVAVGACPGGSCIYVGDIGDNDAERPRITVYRLAEPVESLEAPAASDVFHAVYPDRPQDAEALLISPEGRLFVVTKGSSGPPGIYAFPPELPQGATVRLERVGAPEGNRRSEDERITDGSVSPDGRWVVLRTKRALILFAAADFFAGRWKEAGRQKVDVLREPQGEGVTFGAADGLYLVGEGGGGSHAGTFARLTCTFSG